jgi:hypothetical protein
MDRIQVIGVFVGVFAMLNGIVVLLVNAEVMRLRKQLKQMAGVMSVSVDLTSFRSKQWVDSTKEGKK